MPTARQTYYFYAPASADAPRRGAIYMQRIADQAAIVGPPRLLSTRTFYCIARDVFSGEDL